MNSPGPTGTSAGTPEEEVSFSRAWLTPVGEAAYATESDFAFQATFFLACKELTNSLVADVFVLLGAPGRVVPEAYSRLLRRVELVERVSCDRGKPYRQATAGCGIKVDTRC